MPVQPNWKVVFYEEEDGYSPVEDYIFTGHGEKDVDVIMNVLKSLQARGPDIQGTDMDKHIDGPIRELRKGRHRILYARVGRDFILLSAFLKKTLKTPPEEISLAHDRLNKYHKKIK